MKNPFRRKRIKVKVSEDHISDGIPGESSFCPIYLALQEQLNNKLDIYDIVVGERICSVYYCDGTKKEVILPCKARQFIRDFDGERFVDPLSFKIYLA